MSEDDVRRTIRDAMSRLVEGKPLRSDGKLTVTSLAEEAGVKRWVLTHRHTDLQDEFRDMAESIGGEPAAVRELRERLAESKQVISRLRAEIDVLKNDRNQLERVVNVLAIENQARQQEPLGVVSLSAVRKNVPGR